MGFMAKKKHQGKITARLPESLSSSVRAWAGEVSARHRYTGRQMGLEDLVSWVLLDFMAKSPEERERIIAVAGPAVEAMREAAQPTSEQPRGIEAEPIPPRRKQAQKRKHA